MLLCERAALPCRSQMNGVPDNRALAGRAADSAGRDRPWRNREETGGWVPPVTAVVLDDDDVFRLRTFLALSHGELNALAFGQGLEA